MKSPLIILNPAARSEKARHLHEEIRRVTARTGGAEIRITSGPGDAEVIARKAVGEGYTILVAAGGDGTINEVVNGIAAWEGQGESRVTLGILPIGTMNVFATELGIPLHSLEQAWKVILGGAWRGIDLPVCMVSGKTRCFVQLAGAGLDAEVVLQTTRESKKTFGPLSYLLSLARLAGRRPPLISVMADDGVERTGSFLLMGNGRFYGGPFRFFRDGSPSDGLLDVLLFRNQRSWDLLRYLYAILTGRQTAMRDVEYFQTTSLELTSMESVPYEFDGEMAGYLPLSIRVRRGMLPVLAPPASISG